jgi:hypothetical protein
MVCFDDLNIDHFTGLLRGDPWLFPKEEPMSEITPPTVNVNITVTVHLSRGSTGESYTWTKDEAEAIRQQLDKVLGPIQRPPVLRPRGGFDDR